MARPPQRLAQLLLARGLVAPRLIADSSELEEFVLGRDNHLRHGWRWDEFGSKIDALMNGSLALRMQDGRLTLGD